MKHRIEHLARAISLGMCVVLGTGSAAAAPKAKPTPEPVLLTATREKLEAQYAAILSALKAEILKSLPQVNEQKKEAFLKAYMDEGTTAAAKLKALRAQCTDKVNDKHPADSYAVAKEAAATATANAQAPAKAVLTDVAKFLADDKLDAKLVKCAVLVGATPRGLAEFAQQGKEQEALVAKLLADDALMKQMLIAGGCNEGKAGHRTGNALRKAHDDKGKYGQAMEIYTAIQQASARASEGLFQRLALAVSLEHAVPVEQKNPKAETNAPAFVDPVKRYLHYEKAYLDGELDPAFTNLTVWDYRNVVDSDAPDSVLAWGRTMLHNYRPDEIDTPDYRWRYVKAVKTDVRYGSADQKYDLPTNQLYQNIIKTGGVCGRRAWFGGFILRCFGIPTVKRPQHRHAALAHWTPAGWVVNLGAKWEWGWTKYGEGVDFAEYTQARKDEQAFLPVLRAQWIGDILGEKRVFGFHDAPSGFWNGVALYRQRAIVEANKPVVLAPVGQELAEANEPEEKAKVEPGDLRETDRKLVTGQNGVITIPSVAYSNPTGHFRPMKSFAGGMQMHCTGGFKAQYVFDAPQAGKYTLAAWVATVQEGQKFLFSVDNGKGPVEIAVPYTIGLWQQTPPVEVTLARGPNALQFAVKDGSRGVAIKDFTLTPVK